MQKTMALLLFMFVVSGFVFSACLSEESVNDNDQSIEKESEDGSEKTESGVKLETETEAETGTKPGDQAGAEAEAETGTKPGDQAGAEAEAETGTKPGDQAGAQAGAETGAGTKPGAQAGAETEAEAGAETVVKPESNSNKEDTKEPVVTTKYVDGTYSQSGSYQNPAGPESIKITVTLKGDVVSGLSVTSNTVNETAKIFQGQFISGINSLVVGKKLDEIDAFSQVNGSSLTPKGFNSAMASVKTSALSQ